LPKIFPFAAARLDIAIEAVMAASETVREAKPNLRIERLQIAGGGIAILGNE